MGNIIILIEIYLAYYKAYKLYALFTSYQINNCMLSNKVIIYNK